MKRLEPTDTRKNELDILRDAAEQVTTDLIGEGGKEGIMGKEKPRVENVIKKVLDFLKFM